MLTPFVHTVEIPQRRLDGEEDYDDDEQYCRRNLTVYPSAARGRGLRGLAW